MEIKIDKTTRFLLKNSYENPQWNVFRDNKLYLMLDHRYNYPTTITDQTTIVIRFNSEYISDKTTTNSQLFINTNHVEIIPVEEYEKYDEIVKEYFKEVQIKQEQVLQKCLIESKTSFSSENSGYVQSEEFTTNYNFIIRGKWVDNTFTNILLNYKAVCCALTKTSEDLEVYIPKIWLNYFGYTTYDLIEYLKFLSKCEIGFEYEYLAEKSPNFDNITINTDVIIRYGLQVFFNIVNKHNNFIIPEKNDGFICIRLRASKNTIITYLRFIVLRYIYNDKYATIPRHALQIKKALGNLVTPWEALLLAHLYEPYYSYYCLTLQDNNNFVDPFQKSTEVILRVIEKKVMNMSFLYKTNYSRVEIDSFFKNKDWFGLYWYCKNKA